MEFSCIRLVNHYIHSHIGIFCIFESNKLFHLNYNNNYLTYKIQFVIKLSTVYININTF